MEMWRRSATNSRHFLDVPGDAVDREASLLFENGKNVKQVSEWLGHADPSFTLSTYIHLLDDGIGGADFFDEALEGSNNGARGPHKPEDPIEEGVG
jgi:integrase